MRRMLAGCAFLMLLAPAPGTAQQPDSVRTAAERIRERLRNLGPLIQDTTRSDTLAADTLGPPPPDVEFVGAIPAGAPSEGLTGVARDSVWQQLLRLAGFVATEYQADSARFVADSSRLDLRGAAEVLREGARLQADTSIIFYQRSALACAYGNPIVSGAGVQSPVRSDSLCYDTDRQIGRARGARTQVDQGGTWYVSGDPLVTMGEDVYTHDAVFTDCALDIPHYHFGAGMMKVVRNNVMVARDVTLRFGDVPVLWMPFFIQSLARGRRSGLLTPRFSINDIAPTSTRYARQIDNVGVYWAINDHLGAETALGWRSGDYTKLRGLFEYRFNEQFLSGGVNVSHFWESAGGTSFTISTNNSWRPDERTDVRLSGDYASSSRFIETRTIDPRELTRSIASTLGMSRRFDWGSVQLDGRRTQYLSENRVLMQLPTIGLSFSPLTLFEALPGEERWYSNATVNASGRFSLESNAYDEAIAPPSTQDNRRATAEFNPSFSLGNFSLSQRFSLDDDVSQRRERFPLIPGEPDSTFDPIPRRAERRMDWSTGISYQQRLIGSTTLTPGLSLRGSTLQGDTTGGQTIASPTRLDFNASLQTDLFGFWPGVGAVERIRHKLSPRFSYNYSPKPTLTPAQRQVFTADTLINEVSRITIGLNQTFEAKIRRSARDSAIADSIAMVRDTLAADTASGPRRRQQEQPMLLLGINTDALVYDFVAARERGRGVQTLEIGNTLQSDLFRGLQISFAHRLFRDVVAAEDEGAVTPLAAALAGTVPLGSAQQTEPDRRFDPFLSRVSASFSLDGDSWIFRRLGLASERTAAPAGSPQQAAQDSLTDESPGAAVDRTGAGMGLFGAGPQQVIETPAAPVGSWNSSFSYTLYRADPDDPGARDNQMLTANLTLQPTPMWGVQWNTGYSFTDSQFTDHILTFTRRMHDWDAYFDFIKAQNGNFSFQFRVSLRANPDIKLDYEQQDLRGLQRPIR